MKNPEVIKQLENVLNGLASQIEKETMERNEEKITQFEKMFEKDERRYDFDVSMMFLDMQMAAAQPFIRKHGITDRRKKCIAQFLFGGELEHFVRRTIENKEGSPFSGDKERFVIGKIKQYLITDQNQGLYEEYENKGRQAYWSPGCFKDTDDVIQQFLDWWNCK